MVHALETARRLLAPGGCLIDIHPTAAPVKVVVRVGRRVHAAGYVRETDEGAEYLQADAALEAVRARRLFAREDRREFPFIRYADSLSELQEHLAETWVDAYLEPATVDQAAALLARGRGTGRLILRETGCITRLRRR